jgi:DNA-binding transcriptional MerR regulator
MQGLGFSLQQIKCFLDLRDHGRYACDEVRNLFKNKLIEIRSKIRELRKLEGHGIGPPLRCKPEAKSCRLAW